MPRSTAPKPVSKPDPIPVPTKPLDQMNSLRDMGNFPPLVHAGATLNILITIGLTLPVLASIGPAATALAAWITVVLFFNLLPVILLRATRWRADAPMPGVRQMDFFKDQHRFADWVYLAASANMAFWITLSWCAYTLRPEWWIMPALLVLAFVCTFAPVWLRLFRSAERYTGG